MQGGDILTILLQGDRSRTEVRSLTPYSTIVKISSTYQRPRGKAVFRPRGKAVFGL
ncbi:MAG: hypothetical protein SNG14_04560 [Rikenellaceae bacterium]